MKRYKPYDPDAPFVLPPSLRDWLPEDHLAHFLSDVVDELDLSEIYAVYEQGDGRGQPPYHPLMMTKLVLYAYCQGKLSSRKIERATYEDVGYRMLAANQHPDHDSIAAFRQRHLPALARLFWQVLAVCEAAGLVKLGHVALDGTKMRANASKHKAMSYGRMAEKEAQLEEEIAALLAGAEAADAAEDDRYGKGRRGDELPRELAFRESRLVKIREAKAALEAEAREQAAAKAEEAERKIAERRRQEAATGQKARGREPAVPEVEGAKPAAKAQRNFTDPESRIMVDGATKSFEQGYNAQAVVDRGHQIIVACDVVNAANDKAQLVKQLGQVEANLGRKPKQASADNGFFAEEAIADERLAGIDLYVAVGREKHGESPREETPVESGSAAGVPVGVEANGSGAGTVREAFEGGTGDRETSGGGGSGKSGIEAMRAKLRSAAGRAIYGLRKEIVEPVFGQIKDGRGIRRFSFRGQGKVKGEWCLICLTHNLLKLFRASVVRTAGWAA